jgi:hypothetical protein
MGMMVVVVVVVVRWLCPRRFHPPRDMQDPTVSHRYVSTTIHKQCMHEGTQVRPRRPSFLGPPRRKAADHGLSWCLLRGRPACAFKVCDKPKTVGRAAPRHPDPACN